MLTVIVVILVFVISFIFALGTGEDDDYNGMI